MRYATCIVLWSSVISVAPAAERSYPLGDGRGVLVLNVPDELDDDSMTLVPNGPAHIEFSADETGTRFSMTMGPLPPESKGGPMTTQPQLLKTLTRRMLQFYATPDTPPAEKKPEPFEGKNVRGYWFDITDEPWERVHGGGAVAVGNVIFEIRVEHRKDSPAAKLAREMLATATIDKNARPFQRRLRSVDRKWELVFDASGIQVTADDRSRDGKIRQMKGMDPEHGLVLSIYLEPAAKPGDEDATVVRDYYWSRQKEAPLTFKDVQQAGDKTAATLSYTFAEADQKNRHVYLARDTTWIDVHVSVTGNDPAGLKKMDDLIRSVHIESRDAVSAGATTRPAP